MTHSDESDFFTVDGDRPVLIKPAEYTLRYLFYETALLHGRAPKVIVWFSVCDPGDCFGVAVPRYYNAKATGTKRRRGGKFKVGWKSDLLRDYARVEGLPQRCDRGIRLDLLGRHLLRGRVVTVTQGRGQKEIPTELRYSVVAEITGVEQRGHGVSALA